MKIIPEFLYSKNDEWVEIKGNSATIGISDYAQNALSDIVFLEIIASVGDQVTAGDNIATVESVKAASDVYTPVTGKISAVNDGVTDAPETINQDPFGGAWFVKLTSDSGFDTSDLMNAEQYQQYCDERG